MIIATAGHVDHGKTTLVRVLTGVETDRLPEEKQRGLTIDLGFAYQKIESGSVMGFVDVPGHERFVKNMLAGVATIDFALLVVAADDGIMPQTEEHLSILELLGIQEGAVALTKIDRVEPDRVNEVTLEVKSLLKSTPFMDFPLFPVSGEVGTGMLALRQHLENQTKEYSGRPVKGNFRLSIDRSFIVAGAGLVVTGAVFSGQVVVGDRLILSSQKSNEAIEVRVRGLRALDRDSETGQAGQRCAINIAGPNLHQSLVNRGDWLLTEAIHLPIRKFDARIRLLDTEIKPLVHWTPVHLHLAAADVTGRVAILGERSIMPGENALAQLVLDTPIGALFGDRFIVRDQSAQRTIAGGMVLDPFSPNRGRARAERLELLKAMEINAPGPALSALVSRAKNGINLKKFSVTRNLNQSEEETLRQEDGHKIIPATDGDTVVSLIRLQQIQEIILSGLATWHKNQPEAVGPNDNAIRKILSESIAPNLFAGAIGYFIDQRIIIRDGISLRLPSHSPQPSDADLDLWKQVSLILEEGGTRPPRVRELAEELKMDPKNMEAFLKRCTRQGRLMAVAPNRFFPPAAIRQLAEIVERLSSAAEGEGFTAASFKNDTGIGRNVAIEVLEFFDTAGLTQRQGNVRYLRRPAADIFGDI